MIHRDVKPGNVLLYDGRALLLDFGIALSVSFTEGTELGRRGLSTGTPEYMSPEQACGDVDIDARTDVYGLGCLIFEMLTGRPPFTGRTARTIVTKKLWGDVPSMRRARPDVPKEVDRAVSGALAPIPMDRLQSVGELMTALGQQR